MNRGGGVVISNNRYVNVEKKNHPTYTISAYEGNMRETEQGKEFLLMEERDGDKQVNVSPTVDSLDT